MIKKSSVKNPPAKLCWQAKGLSAELCNALRALNHDFPQLIEGENQGHLVKFEELPAGSGTVSEVLRDGMDVCIRYRGLSGALRGVGAALSGITTQKESTSFKRLGIMLDCSRNRVMTPEHAKEWMAKMALMGYNQILLYCEDTFEVDGEPYFGYMRGGYTMEELKDMDAFAQRLGIELMGCIELLGHCEHILKWYMPFMGVRDTSKVLLVDAPETYNLIDKIIKFWSEALSTRRIHIGMDEAHDMGRGAFMDRFGVQDAFQIFNRHLAKVNSICKNHGLNAMIWSDMYFRIADTKNHNYYCNLPIPPEVAAEIPEDVQLVYWDYYHQEQQIIEDMIERHLETGRPTLMGSGIWTWNADFWYDHSTTRKTAPMGLAAARAKKLEELFFTMWGDNGAMCDYDSALAGLCYCADHGFGQTDEAITSKRFQGICGANYEGAILAGNLFSDDQPCLAGLNCHCRPAHLLYDDPLLGIHSEQIRISDPELETKLAAHLRAAQKQLRHYHTTSAGDYENLNNWLKLLIHKLELRSALTRAYDRGDRAELRTLATTGVRNCIKLAQAFAASYSRQWLRTSKPFGLEVMEIRNAGLIARLNTLAQRLKDYLSGACTSIPELEGRRNLNGLKSNIFHVERVQTAGNTFLG